MTRKTIKKKQVKKAGKTPKKKAKNKNKKNAAIKGNPGKKPVKNPIRKTAPKKGVVKKKVKTAKKTGKAPVRKKSPARKKRIKAVYKVKQKVVYPVHGLGTITQIVQQKFIDEKRTYYAVQFDNNRLRMMIPLDTAVNMGLRSLSSYKTLRNAIKILGRKISRKKDDWKVRHAKNMEKVKSGLLLNTAEVVRDLHHRERITGLSAVEKRLFQDAENSLLGEMSLILKKDIETISEIVMNAMKGKRIRLK